MYKSEIAKKVGISKTTLWSCETIDENMRTKIDKLKCEFKTQGENFLLEKLILDYKRY